MTLETVPQRPVPQEISPLYQAYFDGLSQGQILVPQCRDCGDLQWPPRHMCPRCHGVEFDAAEMPHTATIYTFATAYRAFHPWFAERTPYHMVVGDFGNGVRIVGTMWNEDVKGEIACDTPVVPVFAKAGDRTVLEWKPARTS